MRLSIKYLVIMASLVSSLQGCREDKEYLNPYSGGKAPLGVKFDNQINPTPAEAEVNTVVEFALSGLDKYPRNEISFTFNGVEAEIIEINSSSVKVKVPASASTGLVNVQVQDQVFVGPKFKVLGKIDFDAELQEGKGTDGAISDFYQLSDGRTILVGSFTKYADRTNMNGLVRIREEGFADNTFRQNGGAIGSIYSIAASGSKLFIAGAIGGYRYNPGGTSTMGWINGITRLNEDGSLDSTKTTTYNKVQKAIPAFKGGTNSAIAKIYRHNDKIVAIGGFRWYLKRRYDQPSSPYQIGNQTVRLDTVLIDSTEIPQVLRFELDGELDKTYRFNSGTNRGFSAGNGSIVSSYMHTDGTLLLAGNFTKFDDVTANRLVRLKADGTIDDTFSVGSGANRFITSVDYSESTKKYLVAGVFNSFAGEAVSGVVMLNQNGSVDKSFTAKGFENGYPDFVKRLSNGCILVAGSFDTYGGIRRPGLAILTASGELAAGYNTLGEFNGSVEKVLESTDSQGRLTIMLLGRFSQLNGIYVNNMTRLVLKP